MTDTFKIDRHAVGGGKRCFVIGEVAQAHDGSLGFAHAFIDAIAKAGADAVKFQTHIAQAESSLQEPWRVRFSPQDDTRFDYWKRMEFSEPQWQELKRHAESKGLVFLSTPFSNEAVSLLERIGIAAWKIASGELSNPLLLDQIGATRKPTILSSGMSPMSEMDSAIGRLRGFGAPVAVLQCTTSYPTPPERIGLNLLSEFRQRYGCPVGLSDHSGTIYAGLAAVALEADVLEVHITLSRDMFGPDVPASITPVQLSSLVEGARFIESARSHPIDKDQAAPAFGELRRMFTKSLFAAVNLAEGTMIEKIHLTAKKPGTGIAVENIDRIIGQRVIRPVAAGQMLSDEDIRG